MVVDCTGPPPKGFSRTRLPIQVPIMIHFSSCWTLNLPASFKITFKFQGPEQYSVFTEKIHLKFLHHGPMFFQPLWMLLFRLLFPVQVVLGLVSCIFALQVVNILLHHRVRIGKEDLHPEAAGQRLVQCFKMKFPH